VTLVILIFDLLTMHFYRHNVTISCSGCDISLYLYSFFSADAMLIWAQMDGVYACCEGSRGLCRMYVALTEYLLRLALFRTLI